MAEPLRQAIDVVLADGVAESVPVEVTVMYTLCGSGGGCSTGNGEASEERHRLVRRAVLELALHTFTHLEPVEAVVALLPPAREDTRSSSVLLRRSDVALELGQPLAATLAPEVPRPKWLAAGTGRCARRRAHAAADLRLGGAAAPGRQRYYAAHPDRRRAEGGGMNEAAQAALERAKARLDELDLYPEPVRIDRLRVFVIPWLFRLPLLSRLDAFTLARTIVFRKPPGGPRGARASDSLVTHELVHIWQGQHRRVPLILSFVRHGYRENPFEQQARAVAAATREPA